MERRPLNGPPFSCQPPSVAKSRCNDAKGVASATARPQVLP